MMVSLPFKFVMGKFEFAFAFSISGVDVYLNSYPRHSDALISDFLYPVRGRLSNEGWVWMGSTLHIVYAVPPSLAVKVAPR